VETQSSRFQDACIRRSKDECSGFKRELPRVNLICIVPSSKEPGTARDADAEELRFPSGLTRTSFVVKSACCAEVAAYSLIFGCPNISVSRSTERKCRRASCSHFELDWSKGPAIDCAPPAPAQDLGIIDNTSWARLPQERHVGVRLRLCVISIPAFEIERYRLTGQLSALRHSFVQREIAD